MKRYKISLDGIDEVIEEFKRKHPCLVTETAVYGNKSPFYKTVIEDLRTTLTTLLTPKGRSH